MTLMKKVMLVCAVVLATSTFDAHAFGFGKKSPEQVAAAQEEKKRVRDIKRNTMGRMQKRTCPKKFAKTVSPQWLHDNENETDARIRVAETLTALEACAKKESNKNFVSALKENVCKDLSGLAQGDVRTAFEKICGDASESNCKVHKKRQGKFVDAVQKLAKKYGMDLNHFGFKADASVVACAKSGDVKADADHRDDDMSNNDGGWDSGDDSDDRADAGHDDTRVKAEPDTVADEEWDAVPEDKADAGRGDADAVWDADEE